eukprot:RCo043683
MGGGLLLAMAAVLLVVASGLHTSGFAPAPAGTTGFHSKPVPHDALQPKNKFSLRDVVQMEQIVFGSDATTFNGTRPCHVSVDVAWSAEVGSSVYATPLITDLFGDGRKEIITPTYVHYVEVLDGETGADAEGWPYLHNGIGSHSSALVHDIDEDGHNELMYTTETGELVFFRDDGQPVVGRTLKVPPLKVPKRWYETSGATDAVNEAFLREAELQRQKHLAEQKQQHQPATG